MATFRTDRERRMLGDRIVARKTGFVAVHAVLGEVHHIFEQRHAALSAAIASRTKEEREADDAREKRDALYGKLVTQYAWAHNELPRILAPSWNDAVDPDVLAATQSRIFPLGPPSVVSESGQLVLDASDTFLTRVALERFTYPAGFLETLRKTVAETRAASGKVNREADEAGAAGKAHLAARASWDDGHAALKEITSGFLRLVGKQELFNGFFQELPANAAAGEHSPDTPAPSGNPPTG